MGNPAIFSGKFTKLLTQKGIMNSDSSLNQYDGNKNYITNSTFENNAITGWSLFNTTITSFLPIGSINSGATTLTLAPTNINALSGTYSLQCLSPTTWATGQGFISNAFTIEREDFGKTITIAFNYEVVSGSGNANFSGVLGTQTFIVYVYDVTASAWVQPTGYLTFNTTSGIGQFIGTFTASSVSGQQYRIAFLTSKLTTGSVTINFDNFTVGQSAPSYLINNKVNKNGDTMTGPLIVSGSVNTGQSMVRITNTGTGDCLVVEDSANPDISPFKIDQSGVVIIGSALSTLGGQSKMILGDSGTCQIDLYSSTNSMYVNSGPTESRIGATTGPLGFYTTDTAKAIQIYPAAGDGLGPAVYCTTDGINVKTGINNQLPTEALDVIGNVKSSGTVVSSNVRYIAAVGANEIDYSLRITQGSSVLNGNNGMTTGSSGTVALANFSSANTLGKIPHVTCTTTSTSGSTTGIRGASTSFSIGGGLRFRTVFMVNDAATVAGARHFCGMNSVSTATGVNSGTNTNPYMTSLTNFFSFGHDSAAGDTKFFIYHNGATAGSTTKITLQNNYSIVGGADLYDVEFYNPTNTNILHYTIKGLISGLSEYGTITTNLPTTVQLYGHNERFNGTSAAVVRLEAGSIGMYSGC